MKMRPPIYYRYRAKQCCSSCVWVPVSQTMGLTRPSFALCAALARYLCDYSYYLSLYEGKRRCAFVHVPPLEEPYSAKELGQALQAVVTEMLGLLTKVER